MKYGILISLFFMIMNSVAMDAKVDWESEYKAYAQRRCEAYSGTEREMLKELADVAVQKENPQRYELVAQRLKEIYEYSDKIEKCYNFLGCAIELLNPSKTIHLDFDKNNSSVYDIYEKINYRVEDGPSEEDSDI
ncbi:MAG: hypothetical protein IJ730_05450 [Alphaproteobacteria bacterium]|nr:hypothetical protein [Alphaproteobacteria bacterium]